MVSNYGFVGCSGFTLGLSSLPMTPLYGMVILKFLEINADFPRLFAVHSIFAFAVVRIVCRGIVFKFCSQGLLLGLAISAGSLVTILASDSWKPFGWYIIEMALFHYTEFLVIAVCNPKSLTPSSFLLNHSIHYGIAAVASWLEYILWHYYLPGKATLKTHAKISQFLLAIRDM